MTLRGGTTDPRVKDLAGNALATTFTWTFTTASGPAAAARPPTRSSRRTACPATRRASGTSPAPATPASRASPPTSASTAADGLVQGQHHRDELPPRHLPPGLLRRPRRAQGGDRARRRPACRRTSRPASPTRRTGLVDCGNWAVSGLVGRARRRGLRHLLRQARAHRHRRREPHRLRRPRRRGHVAAAVPDLGHDLAGLQQLRRQQPVHRRRRPAAPTRSATTGRSPRADVDNGQDWLFNAEYPMVRWLEANGYDVSYTTGVDTDRARRTELLEAQGLPVGRPRRVLVRRRSAPTSRRRATPASTSRSSAATRCSGRRAGRPASTARTRRTARSSPTRRRTPTRRSTRTPDVDRHLARPALQPAGRRRPARERADRHALHGQRRRDDLDHGAGGRRQDALLAQHQRRHARRRPRRRRCRAARSATSGTRTSTTASRPPG